MAELEVRPGQDQPSVDPTSLGSDTEWIEWGGNGPCPVPRGTHVSIRFGDGEETSGTIEGSRLDWSNSDDWPDSNIVAYRIDKAVNAARATTDPSQAPGTNNNSIREEG